MEDKYQQINLFDDDFLYDTVYETKSGYILDITKSELDQEYTYTAIAPNGDYIDSFTNKENALDMKQSAFFQSEIYKKFIRLISQYGNEHSKDKQKNKWPYNRPTSTYSYTSYTPTYALSTDQAIEKYCKSNTLCFHKTDPTTTMLEQIYRGRGWDVVNNSNEMSSETISELIDRHERVVMLGHGSSFGLIGFIRPEHAPHLESKKLFALWCNADAYCDKYLPNKKGFFACGNMPSDDGEARAVGFVVTHKYMDDNITYWCKLCGDVVEKCLEGQADAGCKYIREKYWEKYHKGSSDEVGITKYNYIRTKVAGQANLPEPTGEEIIGPKETELQRNPVSHSNYGWDEYTSTPAVYHASTYTKDNAEDSNHIDYEEDKNIKSGDTLFTTSRGYFCVAYKRNDVWDCRLYSKDGMSAGNKTFQWLAKNGENVYDSFVKTYGKDRLGEFVVDADFTVKDNGSEDEMEFTLKNNPKDNEGIIGETDTGYFIKEDKVNNFYRYMLLKGDKWLNLVLDNKQATAEEALEEFKKRSSHGENLGSLIKEV